MEALFCQLLTILECQLCLIRSVLQGLVKSGQFYKGLSMSPFFHLLYMVACGHFFARLLVSVTIF